MNTVRKEEEIRKSIRSKLHSRIDRLTNFLTGSTNELLIAPISSEVRRKEERLLAIQLAHSIDYCNGVDEDDLVALGLDDRFEPEDINQYLDSSYLDELAKDWSRERKGGERADGTVDIFVSNDNIRIYEGFEVATVPDSSGNYQSYYVDADTDGEITDDIPMEDRPYVETPDGQDRVEVEVIAEDVGPSHETPAETIDYLPAPGNGILDVNNPVEITGGTTSEKDSELKFRTRSSLFGSGRGSTARGVEVYAREEVEGLNDIYLDEYPQYDPVYVDVIADGGNTVEIENVLDYAHPSGMRHVVRRPETYRTAVRVDILESDGPVDTDAVESTIQSHLQELDLGEDLYRSKLRSIIVDSDPNIENIEVLEVKITRIDNERHRYFQNTNQYPLKFGVQSEFFVQPEIMRVGQTEYPIRSGPVEPGTDNFNVRSKNYNDVTIYTEDVDYERVDSAQLGTGETIRWLDGGNSPNDGQTFEIVYKPNTEITSRDTQTYDTSSDTYDLLFGPAIAGDAWIESGGTIFKLGEDFQFTNQNTRGYYNSIQFLEGGNKPTAGEEMTIVYETATTSIEQVTGTVDGKDYIFQEGFDETFQNGDYDENRPNILEYPFIQDIVWNSNGTLPDEKTEFEVDYLVNCSIGRDLEIDPTKKVVPDANDIVVNSYTEEEIYG